MVARAASVVKAVRTCVGELHAETDTPNQDAYSTCEHVFAIADGHGPDGEVAAKEAVTALVSTVLSGLERTPDTVTLERVLAHAFAHASDVVDRLPSATNSGATVSVVVLETGRIALANVGDSDVVLGRAGTHAVVISECHRPSLEAERQRILDAGGIVQDAYVCDAPAPRKMISITRALGDLDVRSIGVSTEPYIRSVKLEHPDDFLIIATDGLWDAHGSDITPQVAVDVVKKCIDPADYCKSLGRAADQLLALAKGRSHLPIDDTTIIIVRPGEQLIPTPSAAIQSSFAPLAVTTQHVPVACPRQSAQTQQRQQQRQQQLAHTITPSADAEEQERHMASMNTSAQRGALHDRPGKERARNSLRSCLSLGNSSVDRPDAQTGQMVFRIGAHVEHAEDTYQQQLPVPRNAAPKDVSKTETNRSARRSNSSVAEQACVQAEYLSRCPPCNTTDSQNKTARNEP